MRPSLLLPLLATGLFLGSGFAFGATSPRLVASVAPCQVLRADGSTQQVLHGRYAVVVHDTSKRRFFSFAGPGVTRRTGARYAGTVTWSVRLRKGTYRFHCGTARALRGTLIVG
jgi:hypothetical protein